MRKSSAPLLLALLLAAATIAAYARVPGLGFTAFDDQLYVSQNPRVLQGITPGSVAWAFRTFHAANWHPLTWLSLMLDAEIGGGSPAAYHVTNLVLHLANTLLLFALFLRLTACRVRSAFVAGLFALHPLHVESVAWIAERKDVLSTSFLLLGLLAYARYVERRSAAGYAAVVSCFVLGLLAKPMLVTFPILLLLLDRWPFERRAFAEKLPLVALSAASAVVTVAAQTAGGAVQSLERFPLAARVGNALVSYVVYLAQAAWPSGLTILYPHRGADLPVAAVAGSAAVLAAISAYAYRTRRARPYVAFGWCWYLVTLLPVIGLVQVGDQAHADRYTYVPLIGIFVAGVWLLADLAAGRAALKPALRWTGVLVLGLLGGATWAQTAHWTDRKALLAHLDATIPDYPRAQIALGTLLYEEGATAEAEARFRKVAALDPAHAGARNNLGMCLLKSGRVEEGIASLDEAVRLDPAYAQALVNRGRARLALGRAQDALRDYAEAVRIAPDRALAQSGYAEALVETGDAKAAAEHARRALAIAPRYAQANNVLGVSLLLQGDDAGALAAFGSAVTENPGFADARVNMAGALIRLSRFDEAVEACRGVLLIDPAHVAARTNLGIALARLGRVEEARGELTEALRLRPGDRLASRALASLP